VREGGLAIKSILKQASAVADRIASIPAKAYDANALAQIQAQLDYLRERFTIADEGLAPPQAVTGVMDALTEAETALVNLVAGTGTDPLADLQQSVASAIQRGEAIPAVDSDSAATYRAAKRFRAAGRQAIEDIEQGLANVEGRVAAATQRADDLEASIVTTGEEAAKQVIAQLAPLDAKVSALSASLTAQETRISALQTTQTDSYTEAEQRRSAL